MTGDQAQHLKALRSWLSLEEWFTDAQAQYGLRVVYRGRDGREQAAGPDGPPMGGVVTEIVLVLAGAALNPVINDLYEHVKTSVHAFTTNLSGGERRIEGRVAVEDSSAGADDAEDATDATDRTGGAATDDAAGASGPRDGEAGRIG
ncbi:hypothetical protein V2S66_23290 [Streptomyces sp. V4-01]|uniref:Uncharacterized protein n=1 Tax=Actinacidiphila polyblastidii TaxID=3110430 RepID=A0ABU7PGD4_9ACTN|nr:hypothetical protein [Streptomyces sp. V4-01]